MSTSTTSTQVASMASFTCGSMDYRLSGDAEWEQLSSVLGNDKAIEDVVICPNLSISQKTKSGDSYCQVVWSPQHRAASTVTRVAQNGKIEWHIEWTCLDMPRWGPRTALRGEEGVAAMKTALEMAANFPLPTIVRQTDPAAVHSIRLRLLDSDWTEKPEMQNPAGVLRRLVSGEITYDPETEEGAFLLHMEQALMADFKKQERDLAISKGGRIQTHATEGGAGIVVEIFPAKDPAETEIDLEARKYGQAYAVYSKTVFPKAEAKKHRIHGFGGKPTWQVSINPDLKGYDAPVVGMIANSFSGDVDRYANKTEDGVTFSIILNAVTRDRALDAIGDFQADLNELSMKSLGFLAPQQARSVLPLRGLFLKACRFDWPNENDMPWDEIIEPAESCLQGLNDSQRQMIEISLAYRISLVWGAPGTGKSEAIIRLIDTLRSGNPNERILVCAVANVAVDQIATRAHIYFSGRSKPERMVRIYSETQIDCFYAARNQTALANPIGLQARRIDWARKNDSSDFLAGVTLLEQLGKINDKEVAKKYRKSRDHITEKVLADTFIVFTTCVGSRARALCGEDGAEGAEAWKPGSLIIDEFGNTTPPSVLIPLSAFASTLRRFVAVGEDKELGPFRDSSEAERFYPASFMRQILKKDLFPVTQLNINYRSHSRLFAAVSEVIYNGGITSAYPTEDPSPFLEYYLVRMPLKFQVEGKEYKVETYLNFIDVDGRSVTIPQGSSYNEKEVNVVNALVLRLLDSGFDGRSIIVITPYLLQRSRLRDAARQNGWSHIKRIGTVDTAQGDEAEIVIVSLVKSDNSPGFIGKEQRANVASSRARTALLFVGKWSFWLSEPQEHNTNFMWKLTKHMNTHSGLPQRRWPSQPYDLEAYPDFRRFGEYQPDFVVKSIAATSSLSPPSLDFARLSISPQVESEPESHPEPSTPGPSGSGVTLLAFQRGEKEQQIEELKRQREQSAKSRLDDIWERRTKNPDDVLYRVEGTEAVSVAYQTTLAHEWKVEAARVWAAIEQETGQRMADLEAELKQIALDDDDDDELYEE